MVTGVDSLGWAAIVIRAGVWGRSAQPGGESQGERVKGMSVTEGRVRLEWMDGWMKNEE